MSGFEWQIGDHVLVRGRPWTIRNAVAWPDCTLLRLTSGRGLTRAFLTPFDRPRRIERPRGTRVVHGRRWLHELRRLGSELAPYGGAIAAARASAKLLPHQIEPLLAVLRHGATRLLIADAVGLGKTIQAGLILSELSARAEDFRAIVLVPAGLREQWSQELHDRFALDASQADAAWLRASAAGRPVDVNPWSLPGIYVASIDFAKRAEVLRALEDITWDLVVVDEAHLASGSSDRRTAAHAVAARSRRTVLLTATPDTGDPAAFDALCGIGAIDAAEPAVLCFRRTRAEVADGPPRRSVFLRVRPTVAEERMHDLLDRYTRRVWEEAALRGDARAKLATIVLRKRALSSAASLAVSAQRRLDLLAGASTESETQLLLPLADEDPLNDGVGDEELAAPGLADARQERRWLASVAEAARHASRAESKAARLLRWLARVQEPIIVFTEYRDTLHRLERLIRATGRPLTTLHGGLERAERNRVQSAFNAGGLSLLATDAAAEGLNLHHYCRIVLHYELPWRPARIEQRAGRVDRLGQARRVHEIALIAAGTAERLVLAPLVLRAARARAAGDVAATLLDSLSEAAVSELVMLGTTGGGTPPSSSSIGPGARTTFPTADLRAEAAIEVTRLETARRWISDSPASAALHCSSREATAVMATTIQSRRSGFRPGLVLVFDQTLTDVDGRRVHAEASVLFVQMEPAWTVERSAQSVRQVVEDVRVLSLRPGSVIHEQLAHALDQMAERVGRLHLAAREAIRLREERLWHGQPSAARQMVQAGLFDRRAVLNLTRRAATHDAQRRDADARLRSLERGAHLVGGVELAATLLILGDPA
jgi:superfamily II DNA or RNA helicase